MTAHIGSLNIKKLGKASVADRRPAGKEAVFRKPAQGEVVGMKVIRKTKWESSRAATSTALSWELEAV
jgi:hypothetical protein